VIRALLNFLPHDTLEVGGEPYMRRWYLAGYAPGALDPSGERRSVSRPGWWWNWPFGAVRLHEIVSSDDQRAFHDHPWDFVAVGLRGSYVEEVPRRVTMGTDGLGRSYIAHCPKPGTGDRRRFHAPFVNRKRATDLHSLTVERGPVWTLFVSGRKQRTWGFAGPNGWTHYRDFPELGTINGQAAGASASATTQGGPE
jgi:hypothetical protein